MEKLDYKKAYKEIYLPGADPVILDVPMMRFAVIEGRGDPNGEAFAQQTAALYGFSYSVRMSYKAKDAPEGFYEYTVFPLEGVWDMVDKAVSSADKSNYAYSIMIRQPDFLTEELFARFVRETAKKKPNPYLEKMRFAPIAEGLCCQMLHTGSYDDEPASFLRMQQYCADQGYQRSARTHREIYLADPRKTEPSRLRTVLRFSVKKLE